MPDPRNSKKPKYRSATHRRYDGGRGSEGSVGYDKRDQYSPGSAPRVGGTAQPTSSPGIKSASRGQMKTASRLRRRMGTGSMAHKAARRSRRKLY